MLEQWTGGLVFMRYYFTLKKHHTTTIDPKLKTTGIEIAQSNTLITSPALDKLSDFILEKKVLGRRL